MTKTKYEYRIFTWSEIPENYGGSTEEGLSDLRMSGWNIVGFTIRTGGHSSSVEFYSVLLERNIYIRI